MACFHPLDAAQMGDGSISFDPSFSGDIRRRLKLPCGRCVGCRSDRRRDERARLVCEARLHADSLCATLTYDDEHLPPGGSLCKAEARQFIKDLRKWLARRGIRVRTHLVGEYGDTTGRAHYHLSLFGWWPADAQPWGNAPAGGRQFVSAVLNRIWGRGHVVFQRFTPEAAGYVGGYVTKKLSAEYEANLEGASLSERLAAGGVVVDRATGEIIKREPVFRTMSLRPGIGAGWVERFGDRLVVDGRMMVEPGVWSPLPKYFERLLDRSHGVELEALRYERQLEAMKPERMADSTPERLAVREVVMRAKLDSRKAGAL